MDKAPFVHHLGERILGDPPLWAALLIERSRCVRIRRRSLARSRRQAPPEDSHLASRSEVKEGPVWPTPRVAMWRSYATASSLLCGMILPLVLLGSLGISVSSFSS